MTSDCHVFFPAWFGEAVDFDVLPEEQDVRTSTEVEHAGLLALLDVLALFDGDLAGAHLDYRQPKDMLWSIW